MSPRLSRRSLFRTAGAAAAASTLGAGLGPAGAAVAEPLRLVRVWAAPGQRRLLTGFDDTHVVHPDGAVELLLWPGDLARLETTGLRFQVDVPDVLRDAAARASAPAAAVRTVPPQPGERASGEYRRLAEVEAELRELVRRHPTRARLLVLPYRTLEGRAVLGIEIADGVAAEDGRPVFYQDGCHHAREWPAAELALMWAYDLLESGDPRLAPVLAHVRCVVVPVVNPDGFQHSRETPAETPAVVAGNSVEALPLGGRGRYWRKNRRGLLGRDVGISAGGVGSEAGEADKPTTADAYGVDPNRNYAYLWGDDQGGSSADVTSQGHRGSDPLSEAESRNVDHLLRTRNVLAMVSNHTPGDLVLWPFGDTDAATPDEALLGGLGRAMASYNGYRPQKNVTLYVQSGTAIDHAYGTTGCLAFTFEHAGSAFHPPYAATVPQAYAANREAWLLLVALACLEPARRQGLRPTAAAATALGGAAGGLNHAVLRGRVVDRRGRGVRAVLTLTAAVETPLWTRGEGNPLGQPSLPQEVRRTMRTDADGRFVWHVGPSTRPAVAAAGGSEAYLLTATAAAGAAARTVTVRRGDRRGLGRLVLG